MKRILFLFLLLPVLLFAQGPFGHGGGGASVSQMMAIYADSNAAHGWTAGAHVHQIKPRGGKSVEIDSAFVNHINPERIRMGTDTDAAPGISSENDTNTGIRFPGGDKMQLIQNGLNSHTFRPYRYTQTYSDGDTIGINLDGTNLNFKTSAGIVYFYIGADYSLQMSPNYNQSVTFRPKADGSSDLGAMGSTDRRWRYSYIRDVGYFGGDADAVARIYVSRESNDIGVTGADSAHIILINAAGDPEHIFAGANGNAWKIGLDSNKLTFWFKDQSSWIKKASIDTTGAYTDEY